ncbi:hypothetical protein FF1_002653 [Malus domestica]
MATLRLFQASCHRPGLSFLFVAFVSIPIHPPQSHLKYPLFCRDEPEHPPDFLQHKDTFHLLQLSLFYLVHVCSQKHL